MNFAAIAGSLYAVKFLELEMNFAAIVGSLYAVRFLELEMNYTAIAGSLCAVKGPIKKLFSFFFPHPGLSGTQRHDDAMGGGSPTSRPTSRSTSLNLCRHG